MARSAGNLLVHRFVKGKDLAAADIHPQLQLTQRKSARVSLFSTETSNASK